MSTPPQAVDTSALWQYLPLPDGLDRHEEYAAASLEAVSEQLVFGARVRGRKHKHEGTNCDDWFEFDTVGDWTLMAVSDGAGSCALLV